MSHCNFVDTEVSNGVKYVSVYSRLISDPLLVFNGDGTVSWKDHCDHAKLTGLLPKRYRIVEYTYDMSKEICDAEKSDLYEKHFRAGYVKRPNF